MRYLKVNESRRILRFISPLLLIVVVVMLTATGPAHAQSSGTWTATGTLDFPRIRHTTTLLANGQVLVAGGQDSQGNKIAAAELYDPATGIWTVTGSLATPRIEHTATLPANGEVLVAGGVTTSYTSYTATATATAEVYSPSTGQWTPTGSMTTPRAFAGAALLRSGEVLMAGESNLDGTQTLQQNSTTLSRANGQPLPTCQAATIRRRRCLPIAVLVSGGAARSTTQLRPNGQQPALCNTPRY